MELNFSGPPIKVRVLVNEFCDLRRPTMSYDPQHRAKVEAAYNRHDWRELNRLGATWYDRYGDHWHKFGPHFWDA
jgi:hypothetical protein